MHIILVIKSKTNLGIFFSPIKLLYDIVRVILYLHYKKKISSHPSVPLEDQDAVYVQYFVLFYYILILMAILKHPLAN